MWQLLEISCSACKYCMHDLSLRNLLKKHIDKPGPKFRTKSLVPQTGYHGSTKDSKIFQIREVQLQ